MITRIASAIALLLLIACDPGSTPSNPPKRVADAVAQLIPDQRIAAFFAAEAAAAGLSQIQIVHLGPDGIYGDTRMNSGTRSPVVRINIDRPGGNSPTNLSHEISHAWAFRHGCYNHGKRWLNYHYQMAQRFEAQFPAVNWSGQRPTANVAAKAARYPNDRC